MTRELKHPNMALSGGGVLEILDPNLDDINLEDISWGLARQCRFAGQIRRDIEFYSVAQHSVQVAIEIIKHCNFYGYSSQKKQLLTIEALLHDATEAYIADVISPLKRTEHFHGYKAVEAGLDVAIRQKFSLPLRMSPEVKHADMVMLATEKRDVMQEGIATDWGDLPEPSQKKVIPWSITGAQKAWYSAMKIALSREHVG